jgi:hypothetical protein
MYVTGVKNSVYCVKKFPIWAWAFFSKTREKAPSINPNVHAV